jgi:hypothetical protein
MIFVFAAGSSGQNGMGPDAQALKRRAEQAKANPSGDFTWDLGMVYPGVVYRPPFPLSNGCPFEQLATIAYPNSIPLTGPDGSSPTQVGVPPGTITELLRLYYPPDTTPSPNAFCTMEAGLLTAIHHEDQKKVPGGTYTCYEAKRTFLISACVYHGPGGDDGGGGGGGKKKSPETNGQPTTPNQARTNACATYWATNHFVPSSEAPTPEACTDYIRQQAHLMFDQYLNTNRVADPARWAWVPTGSAIDSLSVEQIMADKVKVLGQLIQPAS